MSELLSVTRSLNNDKKKKESIPCRMIKLIHILSINCDGSSLKGFPNIFPPHLLPFFQQIIE